MKSPSASRGRPAAEPAPGLPHPGAKTTSHRFGRTPTNRSPQRAGEAAEAATSPELVQQQQDSGGAASSASGTPGDLVPDDWETRADAGIQQEATTTIQSGADRAEEHYSTADLYAWDERMISRATELHNVLKVEASRAQKPYVKDGYESAASLAAALLEVFQTCRDEQVHPLAAKLLNLVDAIPVHGHPWTAARKLARDVLLMACCRGVPEAELSDRGMPEWLWTRILAAHNAAGINIPQVDRGRRNLFSQLSKAKRELFTETAAGCGPVDVDPVARRKLLRALREGKLLYFETTDGERVLLARAGQATCSSSGDRLPPREQ